MCCAPFGAILVGRSLCFASHPPDGTTAMDCRLSGRVARLSHCMEIEHMVDSTADKLFTFVVQAVKVVFSVCPLSSDILVDIIF